MSKLENFIFGPLGTEACNYFYFLTGFAFISIIIFIISAVFMFITKPKTINSSTLFNSLLLLLNLLIAYFVNRVFYNICRKTL
jgi:ABC-type transport system involved in cytochrome bd biosynthesis fused ATPase/permease subunit